VNRLAFNVATGSGVLLVSVGAGLVYLPAGLIVCGALVLWLTLRIARLAGVAG
jgi:hypothetical protein